MNLNQFLKLIWTKKQAVILIMVVFILICVLVTVVQPFKYGSNIKLLTVYSFKENTDPYITSKSNEYLSNLLSKIVYSNSFFEKIKESGFNIDKSYFKGDDRRQIKNWGETVRARNIVDTGMIDLDVYHTDRNQAEQIARAIAFTLQTEHGEYHGFGKNVEIKIIDKPITSTFPVKPNIAFNLLFAITFGFIFSLVYVYLFPEEEHGMKILNKNKKDNNWKSTAEIIEENDVYRNYEVKEDEIKEYEENEVFKEEGSMDNILNK